MDSTRIWTSHFDKELSVSIKVPVEWEVGKNDDFKLLILSPPIDGFRANVGINVYNFKGDMASFEAAIKGA